ncbi:MAG: hypothetical protein IPL79_04700 [Myxococcales bacterium]|nr:hypothetical protein [Myxococcales bacterium]
MQPLSPTQRLRYSRQLVLAAVGDAGQTRICNAHVAVPFAGHGGESLALTYLIAAGLGELSLVGATDNDDARQLCALLRGLRPDARVSVVASAPADARELPGLSAAPEVALWQIGRLLLAVAEST